MNLHHLTQPTAPWFHVLSAAPSDAWDALHALEHSGSAHLAVRFVRGRKARHVADFFNECAAALQFPLYFGENWDAAHDCLADLAWLRADGLVVCVTDAGHLLDAAPAEQVQRFVTVLNSAAHGWNQPKPPKAGKPFHLVLQALPSEEAPLLKRWQAAGMQLNRLPH